MLWRLGRNAALVVDWPIHLQYHYVLEGKYDDAPLGYNVMFSCFVATQLLAGSV